MNDIKLVFQTENRVVSSHVEVDGEEYIFTQILELDGNVIALELTTEENNPVNDIELFTKIRSYFDV